MKHRTLFSSAVAVCLATTGLPATAQPTAVTPPCMPQVMNVNGSAGFYVDPPIQPGRYSWMRFVVNDPPVQADQFDLAVSRPDGSKRHLVRFTRFGDVRRGLSGSDQRPYGIGDAGTWILYDHTGKPWQRYVAQLESRYSSVSVPERIVTAGEKVTIRTRLVGWNTASTLGPVAAVGHAVRIAGTVYPKSAGLRVYLQRWNGSSFVTIANGPLASTGSYAFSYRPSTRGTHALRVFTPYDGWHASSASPNAYLKVS